MRRWGATLVVALLVVPVLTASAQGESVRDDFETVSFEGDDGSRPWSGPWVEIGEVDGPSGGQVAVASTSCSDSNCLRLTGGLLGQVGARRGADLSVLSTPTLTFDTHIGAALASTGTLRVQVRGKGSGWVTLSTETLLLKTGKFTESFDVSAYAGADFELRFLLDSLLGGDRVSLDRVRVEGVVSGDTTTSSTTSTSKAASSSSTSTTSRIATTSTSTTATTVTGAVSTPTTSTPSTSGVTSPTVTQGDQGDEEGAIDRSPSSPALDDDIIATAELTTTSTTDRSLLVVPISRPPSGGLREPALGLLADYREGMMGDFEDIEVLGANLSADFSLAVEIFERIKFWIALLALIVTAAIVGGIDGKRAESDRAAPILRTTGFSRGEIESGV